MQRRTFLVLTTAFVVAGCSSSSEFDTTTEGDGGVDLDGGGLDVDVVTTETVGGSPQPTLAWLREQYGDTVFFAFDSSTVTGEGQRIVADWAAWMRQFPAVSVTLQGHCDERGTREYNLALGERRAEAVRSLIVAMGVAPGRVATISYGKERPAVEGHSEAAWARNRRVVLTLA